MERWGNGDKLNKNQEILISFYKKGIYLIEYDHFKIMIQFHWLSSMIKNKMVQTNKYMYATSSVTSGDEDVVAKRKTMTGHS